MVFTKKFWIVISFIFFVKFPELHRNKNVSEMFSLFWHFIPKHCNPANNYIFKFSNRNFRKRCEMRSKLRLKTPERRHWHPSHVFIVNFEHFFFMFLLFLLFILGMYLFAGNIYFLFNEHIWLLFLVFL